MHNHFYSKNHITMKVKISKSATDFLLMTATASAIVFVSMSLVVKLLKHIWA